MESRWSKGSPSKLNTCDDTQQQQRIIAFAATENLTDLSASDRIYCDGTFYPCPSVFHQIYTIHIQIDGIMYPVVYALLPSKSEQVYTRFFNLVQRTMITNNLPFSPTTVFMDFERAAQNANPLSMSWNCHQMLLIHYIQCIWRKAQMTGLQIPYRDNEDIRKLVRRAAALHLFLNTK